MRAAVVGSNGAGIDVAQLVKAKKLVGQLGGVEQAKRVIDTLARILE